MSLDEIRTETVRMRGFLRAAETQATKVIALIDAEPVVVPEPTPEPEPEPTPEPPPAPTPTPSTGAPFYADTFDDAATGASVQGRGSNGFTWGVPHDGVYVVDDGGGKALRLEYGHETDPHWWAEQGFNMGRNVTDLWIEYTIKFPVGFLMPAGTAQNNKFLALWGDGYQGEPLVIFQLWTTGDPNVARIDVARTMGNRDGNTDIVRYPRADAGEGPLRGGNFLVDASDRGRKIRVRVHVKLADLDQSNGRIQLWKDDTLLIDIQNDPLFDEGRTSNYLRSGYLMGYDNARFATPTSLQIDDVKFYDTPQGW